MSPLSALDSCRVLALSASQETTGELFRQLSEIITQSPPNNSGEILTPQLHLTQHPLSHDTVALVAGERSCPGALVIFEIPANDKENAEAIVEAIYHADSQVQMLLLLTGNMTLGKSLGDFVSKSNRIAILRLPVVVEDLFSHVRVLSAKWLQEQNTALSQAAQMAKDSQLQERREKGYHAQTIANLASGIAHEFNNVLTIIRNQADITIHQVPNLPSVVKSLELIMECTRSATSLSRKLAALGPKEQGKPEAIHLEEIVNEGIALLSKTLGEDIILNADHAANLPAVWADRAAIDQMIIHVAIHVREALQNGGNLTFITRHVNIAEGNDYASIFPSVRHGSYVLLTIEDSDPTAVSLMDASGAEADASTSARVDLVSDNGPFTWIREALHLNGGAFSATAIPGVTRRYQLLFSIATAIAPASISTTGTPPQPSTVLVVDDDETICMVINQVLGMQNHRVLVANNADDGWQQWRQHSNDIKLVITDINMPGGFNGIALGQCVQQENPAIPVIYTSGYRATHQYSELTGGVNYLPKPFGMADLLKVVHFNLTRDAAGG